LIYVNDEAIRQITVKAYNNAGLSPSSTPDNGSTYLMHFADGPAGNVFGENRSGQPFSVHLVRPDTVTCPVRYTLEVYSTITHTILFDSIAVDSFTLAEQPSVISDTLPEGTQRGLKLVLVATSISRSITLSDTTDSTFCLATCLDNASDQPVLVPDHFELAQNYPNPFNPETQISFLVPTQADVKINIYNINGQLVKTLVNENITAGVHHITWNGLSNEGVSVSSGLYLYRMTGPGFVQTRKMLLLK
jgi:hypothetical protein